MLIGQYLPRANLLQSAGWLYVNIGEWFGSQPDPVVTANSSTGRRSMRIQCQST